MATERRRCDRVPADVAIRCRVPASQHSGTLTDISRLGCRLIIHDFGVARIGATVHLDLAPDCTISGEVVWAGVGPAGVRFHRPLPDRMATVLGLERYSPRAEFAGQDIVTRRSRNRRRHVCSEQDRSARAAHSQSDRAPLLSRARDAVTRYLKGA
jgi:hypothetical protein